MSKRHKFVLLTWIGPEVPALKKAKMSLEKTQVKALIISYAVEIQSSDLEEMALDSVSTYSKSAHQIFYNFFTNNPAIVSFLNSAQLTLILCI